jgi:tetratricopeptide (TPR) repeat protein
MKKNHISLGLMFALGMSLFVNASDNLNCADYAPPSYEAHTSPEKPVIRNKIYDLLSKAQKQIDEQNYDEAEQHLLKIISISSKKSMFYGVMNYELAMANNMLGFVFLSRGDLNMSAYYYKKAIAQPETPVNFPNSMKDRLSFVYEKLGDFGCAIIVLESIKWSDSAKLEADTNFKLAQLYSDQKHIPSALEYLRKTELYYVDQGLPLPDELATLKTYLLAKTLNP